MYSCNSDIEDERLYMVVEIRMYICGYFNDVENVTVEDMLSQWSDAKKITNDFEGCKMIKVYTSGTFSRTEKTR